LRGVGEALPFKEEPRGRELWLSPLLPPFLGTSLLENMRVRRSLTDDFSVVGRRCDESLPATEGASEWRPASLGKRPGDFLLSWLLIEEGFELGAELGFESGAAAGILTGLAAAGRAGLT